MPSSASKATRKKQAQKAEKKRAKDAGDEPGPPSGQTTSSQQPTKKGKKAKRSDPPRKKQYIAPVKPKGLIDPVDLYGVHALVQPQTTVILRRMNKKDSNTLTKALEEFEAFVRSCLTSDDAEVADAEQELVACLPVWIAHFPRLALHSSRRIRFLTSAIQTLLCSSSELKSNLASPIHLENTPFLASWLLLAHDSDRQIQLDAPTTWNATVVPNKDDTGIYLAFYASDLVSYMIDFIESSSNSQPSDSQVTSADESGTSTPIKGLAESRQIASPSSLQELNQEEDTVSRTSRLLTLSVDAIHYLFRQLHQSHVELFESVLNSDRIWHLLRIQEQLLPTVRRAAWNFLLSFLTLSETPSFEALSAISKPALYGAYEESSVLVQRVMWRPFLLLLQKYPQSWQLADQQTVEEDASGSDEEERAVSSESKAEPQQADSVIAKFLDFVSFRADLDASSNFQAIIVLLISIPTELFSVSRPDDLSRLFEAYWKSTVSQPMLESLLEVLAYAVKRTADTDRVVLVNAQLSNVATCLVEHLITKRLDCQALVTTIDKLNSFDQTAATAATGAVEQVLLARLEDPAATDHVALVRITCDVACHVQPQSALVGLLSCIMEKAVALLQSSDSMKQSKLLLDFINGTLSSVLERLSTSCLAKLDHLLAFAVPGFILEQEDLMDPAMSLFQFYIQNRTQHDQVDAAWTALCSVLPAADSDRVWHILSPLLIMSRENVLPRQLSSAGLDPFLRLQVDEKVLNDSAPTLTATQADAVANVLISPIPFVSPELPDEILQLLCMQSETMVDSALLSGTTVVSLGEADIAPSCPNHFRLLAAYVARVPSGTIKDMFLGVFKAAFTIQYLIDLTPRDHHLQSSAEQLWQHRDKLSKDQQQALFQAVKETLVLHVSADHSTALPARVVEACSVLCASQNESSSSMLLPSESNLESLRADLVDHIILLPALAITDAINVAPVSQHPPMQGSQKMGYIRAMVVVAKLLAQDRPLCHTHVWLLEHFVFVRLLVKDAHREPALLRHVFGHLITLADIPVLETACDALISYMFSSSASNLPIEWHRKVGQSFRSSSAPPTELDGIQKVLLKNRPASLDTTPFASYQRRVLVYLLQRLLSSSDEVGQVAEVWLATGAELQSSNVQLAMAVFSAATPFIGAESPRLARLQNGAASNLSGVKAADANTKGALLLRQLLSLSPPHNSLAPSLPQQRTVFLYQTFNQWIQAEDVDMLSEDVLAELLLLSQSVAPVLQDVPGAHWDLMFDLIETVLEGATLSDSHLLHGIYRVCQLLDVIEDLCLTNKTLRQVCKARLEDAKGLQLLLFLSASASGSESLAVQDILQLITASLQDARPLTSKGLKDDQVAGLFALLQDNTSLVKHAAFRILQSHVEKQLSDLVIEAELASEEVDISLPATLVSKLYSSSSAQSLDSFLLAWHVCFEYINNASLTVKTAYIDQLRSLELVSKYLLPALFSILSDKNTSLALPLWSLHDPDLSQLEEDSAISLPLFAANTYYRALQLVPSLVRTWWEDTKDRQLSAAIASLTSKHFSPILILQELEPLQRLQAATPKKVDPLAEEDPMQIKVSTTVNEIKAIYTVDEQPMELTIRLPAEYPLSPIELKDLKKVGVSDATWRAWILAVQQVITSGNAHIADALELFKKNVSLHFEGVEACSICYSIISLTDRHLPGKKCRTCKNMFHASCLFKWFATSHGSSCPLCRSLF